MAPQSREILQTFVWGGGGGGWRIEGAEGVARQPYKGLLIFATLRSYILARLQRISDLAVFTNIKTLFPVVKTDFPQLVHVKCWEGPWESLLWRKFFSPLNLKVGQNLHFTLLGRSLSETKEIPVHLYEFLPGRKGGCSLRDERVRTPRTPVGKTRRYQCKGKVKREK